MYLQRKNILNKLQMQEKIFYNFDYMKVFEGNCSLFLNFIHFPFDNSLNNRYIT